MGNTWVKDTLAPASGEAQSTRVLDERTWAFDALATIDEAVMVIDERAHLVFCNRAAEAILGITSLPSEAELASAELGLFRRDERSLFPPDELPLYRALAGNDQRDVEMFVRNAQRPNGVHLLVSAAPIRDASGRIRGAASIFRDVTERQRANARLREAEGLKNAILDNIPDMAWLKDRQGRYVAVNQPMVEAAGKTRPEELIGLTDFDLWPRDLAERYVESDQLVMQTGTKSRVEEPFVDARGRSRWIETSKSRIVGSGGEIVGTTGIAHDVTERRLAEEALRMTNDELERRVRERTVELAAAQENLVRKERLAVLGQLAGGVAHQIRNPLAAIMNATYVLRRHMDASQHPNIDDALRIIHDEVRHANVIITGLLDYARVRTPDRHPTSVVDLVERVLAADWIPANIRVERSIDRDTPQVEVDADQLHGALFNLVRNAVEAMPEGGTLAVELSCDDREIVLAVSDTGPGISPQVRAHLFEPLHSTKPMGIGLGLVTARTFVEAHGGRISSVPMHSGARFEIRIPL